MNPVKLIIYIKQSEQIFIDIHSPLLFSFQTPSDYSPFNLLQIILLPIPFRLFSFQSPLDYSPSNPPSDYSPSNPKKKDGIQSIVCWLSLNL